MIRCIICEHLHSDNFLNNEKNIFIHFDNRSMADTQLNHCFKTKTIFNSDKPVPLAVDMEYSMLVF